MNKTFLSFILAVVGWAVFPLRVVSYLYAKGNRNFFLLDIEPLCFLFTVLCLPDRG